MNLLLLGGTAFLGRAICRQALAARHEVVCLARGSEPVEPGVTFVRSDRDRPDAYAAVAGRRWDAVIDLTLHPFHAREAARDLSADHWVFVSSVSVYTSFDPQGQTESGSVAEPLDAPLMQDASAYPSAKVACEIAYQGLGQPLTVIRAGLIGGAGDATGRSGYYPWRFAHPTGPDVLVPDPTHPTALLDGEDLAAWILHCAQTGVTGTFNAVGTPTTLADVYRSCQELAPRPVPARAVDDDTLAAAGVRPWAGPRSLPLWIPDPTLRFMAVAEATRARAHGLHVRPLAQTLADAQRYEETRQGPRPAGLTDDEERLLRARLS